MIKTSWLFLILTLALCASLGCVACDDDDDDNNDAGDNDTDDDDDDDNDTDDDDTADDDTGDDDTGGDDTGDDDTGDDDTTVCEGCLIDEVCYNDLETNPANVCEICDVSQSTDSWSDNDGVTCDDGVFCNGADTCDAGSCSAHTGNPCLGGDACNNTCNEGTEDCLSPDTIPCDDGVFCNGVDLCDGAGECEHPGNPCDSLREYCSEDDGECLDEFAAIPHGTFTMGSPEGELGRQGDETQHSVTLTNDFEMSVFEVTQDRFTMVMDWNPSYFGPNGGGADCGDDCPVEWVSWYDTVAYANELSAGAGYDACYVLANVICEDGTNVGANYMGCMNTTQDGIGSASVALNGVTSVYDCEGYRLPTEAEWEYAARAGTTTAFYSGAITNTECTPLDPNLDLIGWYCGNDSGTTEVVGQKQTNAWGLYDMSGNVWEWNWDRYDAYPGAVTDPEGAVSDSRRVYRGGGCFNYAWRCRSAYRNYYEPDLRSFGLGFRVVRTLELTPGFEHVYNGTFTMGSPEGELGRLGDETQHTVTLTNDFEMSIYETTQGEFTSLMGWNPSYFGPNGGGADCGDDCPVDSVTWYDTVAYANERSADAGYDACYVLSNVICNDATNVGANYLGCMNTTQGGIFMATLALNGVTSVYDCEGYRLPTEAEWEYAARAGTTTA
ncbi:MAG TPA: formylglycine-generating enzyme family protein, partial [bacterium]|nr:formylglycine-generating enzyme family protein [bacterium]